MPKEYRPMWELKQAASSENLELYIYGNVEALKIDYEDWTIKESENSANHFRAELAKHPDAKQIDVFINSYGGSVFEGTAIYNQLRRHPAQKVVHIDGFACSVASVIAMAGDKVIMPRNAMMMIHNMWISIMGNARELRKAADDLDIISEGNRQAYLQKTGSKLSEADLVKMLDAETWLTAKQCIEFGLADEYAEQDADMSKAAEALQLANLNLTQRIELNKALAAQLREMTNSAEVPAEPEKPAELPADPVADPAPPEQNKVLNLFAALKR